MLISLTRTLILYTLVVISLRLMGKRQIGELQPSELVVAIMISDLATVPMSETAIPLLYGIIPIFTLVFAEVFLSYLCLKFPKLRMAVSGQPTFIIKDGVIDQKEMKKARYSISDLSEELRMLDVFDISKVRCALLETSGKISVVTEENENETGYILIADGKIQHNVLNASPFSEKDLKKFIKDKKEKDIFLLSVNLSKEVFCVMKEE